MQNNKNDNLNNIKQKLEASTLGVPSDIFQNIAAQYALHQIKEIKDPKEAATRFKEIVISFQESLK